MSPIKRISPRKASPKKIESWSEADTRQLVDILRENRESYLSGNRKRFYSACVAKWPGRSLKAIKNKSEKLRKQFLDERKRQGRTGAAPSRWPFYSILSELFADTVAERPGDVAEPCKSPRKRGAPPVKKSDSVNQIVTAIGAVTKQFSGPVSAGRLESLVQRKNNLSEAADNLVKMQGLGIPVDMEKLAAHFQKIDAVMAEIDRELEMRSAAVIPSTPRHTAFSTPLNNRSQSSSFDLSDSSTSSSEDRLSQDESLNLDSE